MVITISRQFGSGGREIGKRLSKALNIPFYDKEIIEKIATESNMSEDVVEKYCESSVIKNTPVMAGRSFSMFYQESTSDKVFKKQTEIIRALSEQCDCIFVGRCADYICKNSLDIMVYADIEARISRCLEREPQGEKVTRLEMKKKIVEIDRERARYYEYYTGQRWGDKRYYDICVNTSELGMDRAVAAIIAAAGR